MNYRQWGPCDITVSLRDIWGIKGQLTAGAPMGILAIETAMPKLPGHPAMASTYSYQIMIKTVYGKTESELKFNTIEAAKYLESQGARFLIAASSELACYHTLVANTVDIPVYLSSICQIPWALVALGSSQQLGIITQKSSFVTPRLLTSCGVDSSLYERCSIIDAENTEVFSSLCPEKDHYHAGKLRDEIIKLSIKQKENQPNLGAFLIECPDVMPFASDIQTACNLPVYDTVSLANYMKTVVCKERYYGYF